MKLNKILCLILAFAMVLSTMGTIAFAEDGVTESVEETVTVAKIFISAKDCKS